MIPAWAIQVMTAMACAFAFMIWMFQLRTKFQRQAIDHVQCKYITEHGTSYKKLLKVIDGFVTLKGNEKKGVPDRDYPVAEIATYQIEYPEGWIPKFLKTTIKEAIYREDTCEPQYNRGDPILSPEKLHNIRAEKFTEMGARHALEEAELEKKRKGTLNPTILYILLIATVVIVAGIGIFIYLNISEIQEILGKIAQALGV